MKKINKLLIIASSLLASSVCLTNVVIGSKSNKNDDFASKVNAEGETQTEKFDLMFLLDDTYTITDCEGFTLDENGYASIEKGTQIRFKIHVNDGVKVDKDGVIVKINGNEIGEIGGFYKTTITKDTKITVSGFVFEEDKYRINVKAQYGVNVVSEDHEAYPDGSYLLEAGTFSFKLTFLTGFSANNLVVKANDEVITPVDGLYTLNVKGNIKIEVSGVKYEQLQIGMEETKLFSFGEVSGATIKSGIGYVTGDTVSFKVIPTTLAKVDAGGIVVKNGDEVLEENFGTYSFNPTQNSNITVSGLSEVTEYNEVTMKTTTKEVLNDVAARAIVTTNGAVVSGAVKDMVDLNGGYKKTTYFAGEYGVNQIALNSDETFEKFSYVEFEINPFTSDYIEFYSPVQPGKPLFYIRESGWTKVKLAKTEVNDGFHYFINDVDKGLAATDEFMLSDLQFKMQGSYLFSELVAMRNPGYVDPHYFSDTKALTNATYLSGLDEETEYGTKKWYEIKDSSYGVGHIFSKINPEQYNEMYFEIKPVGDYDGGPWFGFNAAGSTGGFTKDVSSLVIMTKNELGKWTLTLKGKSETKIENLDLGEDLSTSKIFLHPNKGKVTFQVSNFRFVDDPEYDPLGKKLVNVNPIGLSHVTYSIDGHTESSFKVDADTVLTLRVTPEEGFDGVVVVNGDVQEGVDNVYAIRVTKTTTIEISERVHHDIVKLADVFCNGVSSAPISSDCFKSHDPTITTVYQNSKSSGSLFPTSSYDISGLSYVYFYCYNKANTQLQCYPGNSESDCVTCGAKGAVVLIEFKREGGVWNFYCNGSMNSKISGKTTNDFGAIMYMQFWGTNYISPLFGY